MDKYSKDDIFNKVKEILENDFEVPAEKIKPDANLFENLEFDSIDLVDLAVRLQQFTDKKLTPEEFKSIKTVDDVVNTAFNLING